MTKTNSRRASVLIVVIWIVFGLIAVTLYFAHSMLFELRASDNRVAGIEAEQAIEGARRYYTCVLSNVAQAGVMPDPQTCLTAAVPVGNSHFWLIGRGDGSDAPTAAHFGLVDEASKINVNNATSNMLISLPGMTSDLVANLLAWRSTNTSIMSSGAESDTYSGLTPPYLCKNAPFESMEELRLVYGMDMTILYGEDANLNGILDPNENDGDATPPSDNMDGQLNPGLLEFLTVYTIEPSTYTNSTSGTTTNTPRVLITDTAGLTRLLQTQLGSSRGSTIMAQAPFANPLDLFKRGGLSMTEISEVETAIVGVSGAGRTNLVGLVNVNTANLTVLSCIPGLTNGEAQQLITYRQSNTNNLNGSIGWVTTVLNSTDCAAAGNYLTGKGYQYTADIAALGHNGRGYRRTQFVFDTSQGAPVILHREDLSYLGWALGKDVRDKWLLGKQTQ